MPKIVKNLVSDQDFGPRTPKSAKKPFFAIFEPFEPFEAKNFGYAYNLVYNYY